MRNDVKKTGPAKASTGPDTVDVVPASCGGLETHRSAPARRWRTGCLGLFLLPLMLSACSMFSSGSGTPAPKEPAKLDIAITADFDLNIDIKSRGAPLLLRVFELKSDVAFQEAEFFALQASPKAVLGADLLAMDQFIVRPGEKREIKRKSHPETTAIGIFAGYRDLPNAVWRVVHKMPPAPDAGWYRAVMPSHKATLTIDLQSNAIVMVDKEAAARPVQFANESLKGLGENPLDAARQQSEALVKPVSDALPAQGPGVKLPEKPTIESFEGVRKLISSPGR